MDENYKNFCIGRKIEEQYEKAEKFNLEGTAAILINPTLDFLVKRAHALHAQLTDPEAPAQQMARAGDETQRMDKHQFRAVMNGMNEFEDIRKMMQTVFHANIPNVGDMRNNSLWLWFCAEAGIPAFATAMTIVEDAAKS